MMGQMGVESTGEVVADAHPHGAEGALAEVLAALRAAAHDPSVRMRAEAGGTAGEVARAFNDLADRRATADAELARVLGAVARGDLAQRVTTSLDGRLAGDLQHVGTVVDAMVDRLSDVVDEVTRVASEVGREGRLGGQVDVAGLSGTWRRLAQSVNLLAGNLTTQVRAISEVSQAVIAGDLSRSIAVEAAGEVGALKDTINQMIADLRETTGLARDQDWLKSNLARMSAALQGRHDLRAMATLVVSELAPLVDAQHGAVFVATDDGAGGAVYRRAAGYGVTPVEGGRDAWRAGEGLVGQAVVTRAPITLTDVPPGYVRIASGLGEAEPAAIVVLPVLFEEEVLAVIELASLSPLPDICHAFLEQIVGTIGVVMATIIATGRTEELLEESQRLTLELQSQSEELQAQQDELRRSNRELEDQARSLRASEELLQTQQEELQATNAELEEKAAQLVEQKRSIEAKNTEIELARRALEERAEQLALSSRYKSEFLANMSHELRTPLNSLLILAKLLADNQTGNLTPKQVEFASSIHGAGVDLLDLISDILDLSKVEAGKMEVTRAPVDLERLGRGIRQVFAPLAGEKGVDLDVDVDPGLALVSDEQRLVQVLTNLLGNAVKFTDAGAVRLHVRSGGTGLGLSISREIVHLLGGVLEVTSTPGEGSTFTVLLPSGAPAPEVTGGGGPAATTVDDPVPVPAPPEQGSGDGGRAADRLLLVVGVEDDLGEVVAGAARDRGFEVVGAAGGRECVERAHSLLPDAIVVGGADAGTAALLAGLEQDERTRGIPVHVLSSGGRRPVDPEGGGDGQPAGVAEDVGRTTARLVRFLDGRVRRLLVVEDDDRQRASVLELVGGGDDVDAVGVRSAEEALAALEAEPFDCMVLDLELPRTSGLGLLEQVKGRSRWAGMPVIVYTGRELTRAEETRLKRYAETIIVKDVRSPERLLAETSLFLHRVESRLTPERRRVIEQLHSPDAVFDGKRVLVVDDDVRNVFALTSAFEGLGMEVLFAENGREGLEALARRPDVDLVLMDVMMPEMDGYEAMRAIRSQAHLARLPVIALTAKAMKGDRELSIQAGASDYITKPVDIDQLLSLMRVWLYR